MALWLLKTEPDTFSIDTLKQQKVSCWEGVRNYQARNMMRDEMKEGDFAFIYHSSCKKVGVVGVGEIVKNAYPDHFQFDSKSPYFDPKSQVDNPRWFMVDLGYQKHLPFVSLARIKGNPFFFDPLMPLVQKGNRLSIMPVTQGQWDEIIKMSKWKE